MSDPDELPTLYEYYTSGGITSGLSANQPEFLLNEKLVTLYSGAVHYFRVPPAYWRDRLRKVRAAGLNCVETYVPWNLHQPEVNPQFDFGNGGNDHSEFLDIKQFLTIAQEEDLLVIVRPGPFICAEWDFGGMPSWLLRQRDMKLRTKDPKFMEAVRVYLKALFEVLKPFQFTNNGPIIAFQVENEYGNVNNTNVADGTEYLEQLKAIFLENGIKELLFTSDTPLAGFTGTIPGVLATANFALAPTIELGILKLHQPDKPLMVMEFWSGWFDHWTEKHHVKDPKEFAGRVEKILNFGSSINFYMFHGGTNWGFLNGANLSSNTTDNASYQPDTSSYDYDAPLSESGQYTEKYKLLRSIVIKHNKVKTKLPEAPPAPKLRKYNALQITSKLSFSKILEQSQKYAVKSPIAMEDLPINNQSGQSFGYISYGKTVDIPPNSQLKIEGRVCDTVMVLINGNLVSKPLKNLDDFGTWRTKDSTLDLGAEGFMGADLQLLVENWGRVNFGELNHFNQYKGLWQGAILLNNQPLEDLYVVPIEFKRKWFETLDGWEASTGKESGPGLFKAEFTLEETADTYVDMRKWSKGIVIVNGFVLSRHFHLGPQQSAYLPAPFLKIGKNSVVIFEHFQASDVVEFVDAPIFSTIS